LISWHARPGGYSKVIILTDFGAYYVAVPGDSYARFVGDWGLLLNIGESDGIGLTCVASIDPYDATLGPEVRYRRWLGQDQSLDIAVGLPLVSNHSLGVSPYGLVKWNFFHWVGFAVRSELRRRVIHEFVPGGPGGFSYRDRETSQFHLSAGIEFGWWPGSSLTVASLLLLMLFALSPG
jgi:hypothetical protein